MRDDVVETTFEAMSPELRALIAYDPNGALDVEVPQAALDEVRRTMPVVRWEMGVGFFGMDDVVAAGAQSRHRLASSWAWGPTIR